MEQALRTVTEADWQAQVIETMGYLGWHVAHFRPAQSQSGRWMTAVAADGAGFPDLIAIHRTSGDRLVAELKRETEQAQPRQLEWLAYFEKAGIDAFVWRPSDVDAMIVRLQSPTAP
jgi:hypothetical protein